MNGLNLRPRPLPLLNPTYKNIVETPVYIDSRGIGFCQHIVLLPNGYLAPKYLGGKTYRFDGQVWFWA